MVRSRLDPAALLAGPRGRRLCSELVLTSGRWGLRQPSSEDGPLQLVERADPDSGGGLEAIVAAHDPVFFFDALEWSVASARYWQEPDDDDRRRAHPESREQLWPVAEAACAAPAAAWWSEPMDPLDQQEVLFADSSDVSDDALLLPPDNGHDALIRWRSDALATETYAAGWEANPAVPITAAWWSTPAHTRLSHTTRTLPGHGPVGLYLVEDSLRWKWARCRLVRPSAQASIFEIHRPEDWTRLVQSYPLVVTNSRRHDWRRVTGQDGEWAMPDFLAIADHYDAVHLSVAGYLSTAGHALPAGDSFTVLAGWNPDQTWWLTDRPAYAADPVRWGEGLGPALEAWAPS